MLLVASRRRGRLLLFFDCNVALFEFVTKWDRLWNTQVCHMVSGLVTLKRQKIHHLQLAMHASTSSSASSRECS